MATNPSTTVELGGEEHSISSEPEKQAIDIANSLKVESLQHVSVLDSNSTQKVTEIESTLDRENANLTHPKKSDLSQKENFAQSLITEFSKDAQKRENAHLMFESGNMCHQKFSSNETGSSKSENSKDVNLSSALPLSVKKNKQKLDEKLNKTDDKSTQITDMSSIKKQNDLKKESKSSASITEVHIYAKSQEVGNFPNKFKTISDPINSLNVLDKSLVVFGTNKSTKFFSDTNAKEYNYVQTDSADKCNESSDENVNKIENENTAICEKISSIELDNFKKLKNTISTKEEPKNLEIKKVENEHKVTSDQNALNSEPETSIGPETAKSENLSFVTTSKEKGCGETDFVNNLSVKVDEKEYKTKDENIKIHDKFFSKVSNVFNNEKNESASKIGEHNCTRDQEMKKAEIKSEITSDAKTSSSAPKTCVESEITKGKSLSSDTNVKEKDYVETGTVTKFYEKSDENLNKKENENIQITNRLKIQEPNLSNNDKKKSASTTEDQYCTKNQEVYNSASKSGTTVNEYVSDNATAFSAVETKTCHSKSRTSGLNVNRKTSQHSVDLEKENKTANQKTIGPGCGSQEKKLSEKIPRGLEQRLYNKHILQCVMMIPYGFSGQLIGHKGSTIKKLSKESLTHIHLDLKYFYGPCDELKAKITGSPYQCSEAIKKILILIRKAEYFKQYPLKLFISQEYLGGIIGNQGRFLTEIKKVSRVDLIKIFPTWPKTKKHGVLVIKHKEALTCIKAVKMCLNRLQFLQMNNSDQKRTHCQVLLPEDRVSYVIGKRGANIEKSKIYGVYLSVNHANKKGEQWLTMKTSKGGMVRALKYLFNKFLKGVDEVFVKMPYNDSRQELIVQKQFAACNSKLFPEVTTVNNVHGNISSFLVKGSSESVVTAVEDILYAI